MIPLDLLLLICGFGESCTVVHCITSQPANVSENVFDWYCKGGPGEMPKFLISLKMRITWSRTSNNRRFNGVCVKKRHCEIRLIQFSCWAVQHHLFPAPQTVSAKCGQPLLDDYCDVCQQISWNLDICELSCLCDMAWGTILVSTSWGNPKQ